MPKKNFKDNPALAFIGNNAAKDTEDTTHAEDAVMDTTEEKTTQPYFRFNLKLKGEYEEYLKWVSWRDRKSVTQYINDLIEADREKNGEGH